MCSCTDITVVTVVLKPVGQQMHKNTCGMVSFHTCDGSKGSFPLSSSYRATSSCNTQEWQRISKEHFICIHYLKQCFIAVYICELPQSESEFYICYHCPSCIVDSRRLLHLLKINQPNLFNWYTVKKNVHNANWHLFMKPALSQFKRKCLTHPHASYYSDSWTVTLND